MVGLEAGSIVQARKPNKVNLQCTSVSWNATGSSLAVSYGNTDVSGWCDYPGAVCLWNIFGRTFDSMNPDIILDHSSGIICVKCHPVQPAIVAGGAFSGEIILWDLTLPEQVMAVSPITDYGHKEPVMDMEWVFDPTTGDWLLCTVGADGRLLFWTASNSLKYPVKGALLAASSTGKNKSSSSSSRKGQGCYGGSSLSFSGGPVGGSRGPSSLPKWLVVGQQGGSIVRSQVLKVLGASASSRYTKETFKSYPSIESIYAPVKKVDEIFAHESHVGAVTSTSCSPFNG